MEVEMRTATKVLISLIMLGTMTIQAADVKKNLETVVKLGGQMSNVRLMLETYSLLGMDIKYSDPKTILTKSMAEYETLLGDIEKNYQDDAIKQSIVKSRAGWKPIKEALMTAMEKADSKTLKTNAQFVHDNIRTVIKELANMKKFLLAKNKVEHAGNLNAAIEIGASARRLSSHYMMKLWKLDDPTIQKHWDNGIKIYGDSLAMLKSSTLVQDPNFKSLLSSCEHAYKYFMMLGSMQKGMPTLVHKKAESVYDKANKMQAIILSTINK